jgi:hypothetical protein
VDFDMSHVLQGFVPSAAPLGMHTPLIVQPVHGVPEHVPPVQVLPSRHATGLLQCLQPAVSFTHVWTPPVPHCVAPSVAHVLVQVAAQLPLVQDCPLGQLCVALQRKQLPIFEHTWYPLSVQRFSPSAPQLFVHAVSHSPSPEQIWVPGHAVVAVHLRHPSAASVQVW